MDRFRTPLWNSYFTVCSISCLL
uniref:Uncharacterized protein n=1 Tax=Arundo donax TaxID=35708 RepID=A0A0A8ZNH9_ARUDO